MFFLNIKRLLLLLSTSSAWGRSLLFFGWTVFDLFAWWVFAPSTLKEVFEGMPNASDFVSRVLVILMSCFVFAALDNVIKPFETLLTKWNQLKSRDQKVKRGVIFTLMLLAKTFIGCLCLYGILSNIIFKVAGPVF